MNELQNMFRLDGKVALITGSSKGIGAALGRGMAAFGARVVLCSRKQEAVETVASEIRALGAEAVAMSCHVGRTEQLTSLVENTVKEFGSIDILVNNAAASPFFGPLEEASENDFDKIMNINLKAPWLLSKFVLPHMKASGGGSIIHISSAEGLTPTPGLGLYSTSKAALIHLTRSMAGEWAPYHVRVNAILPGLIRTKFSQALWKDEKIMKHFLKKIPAGRVGQAEEMAGLAIYLASDSASYTTGGIFSADGGWTAV